MWRPDLPGRFIAKIRPVHRFVFNKWYFDELYDFLFVRTAFAVGRSLWKTGDGDVIDGVGPDGIAATTRDVSGWTSKLQSGYLYHYAFAMMIGLVALASWFLIRAVG
jgi:NADH-quinone oxidoreductase subunit L